MQRSWPDKDARRKFRKKSWSLVLARNFWRGTEMVGKTSWLNGGAKRSRLVCGVQRRNRDEKKNRFNRTVGASKYEAGPGDRGIKSSRKTFHARRIGRPIPQPRHVTVIQKRALLVTQQGGMPSSFVHPDSITSGGKKLTSSHSHNLKA